MASMKAMEVRTRSGESLSSKDDAMLSLSATSKGVSLSLMESWSGNASFLRSPLFPTKGESIIDHASKRALGSYQYIFR